MKRPCVTLRALAAETRGRALALLVALAVPPVAANTLEDPGQTVPLEWSVADNAGVLGGWLEPPPRPVLGYRPPPIQCAWPLPRPWMRCRSVYGKRPEFPLSVLPDRPLQFPDPQLAWRPLRAPILTGMQADAAFARLCREEAGEFVHRSVRGVESVVDMRPFPAPWLLFDHPLVEMQLDRDDGAHFNASEVMGFEPWLLEDPLAALNGEHVLNLGYQFVRSRRFRAFEAPWLGEPPEFVAHGGWKRPALPSMSFYRLPFFLWGWPARATDLAQATWVPGITLFGLPMVYGPALRTGIHSRYGYYRVGVRHPGDRELGIAGRDIVVVDLETGEVLAVQRAYVRFPLANARDASADARDDAGADARHFRANAGGEPAVCPYEAQGRGALADFVHRVLVTGHPVRSGASDRPLMQVFDEPQPVIDPWIDAPPLVVRKEASLKDESPASSMGGEPWRSRPPLAAFGEWRLPRPPEPDAVPAVARWPWPLGPDDSILANIGNLFIALWEMVIPPPRMERTPPHWLDSAPPSSRRPPGALTESAAPRSAVDPYHDPIDAYGFFDPRTGKIEAPPMGSPAGAGAAPRAPSVPAVAGKPPVLGEDSDSATMQTVAKAEARMMPLPLPQPDEALLVVNCVPHWACPVDMRTLGCREVRFVAYGEGVAALCLGYRVPPPPASDDRPASAPPPQPHTFPTERRIAP